MLLHDLPGCGCDLKPFDAIDEPPRARNESLVPFSGVEPAPVDEGDDVVMAAGTGNAPHYSAPPNGRCLDPLGFVE